MSIDWWSNSHFGQAVLHVRGQVEKMRKSRPTVFLSYAWGNEGHERWLQRRLAPDLEDAGINLIYDRHENVLCGSNTHTFVDKIITSDKIVVVGTPLYLQKSNNEYAKSGSILYLEKMLIYEVILRGGKEKKVLPILLEGERDQSLPPLLWGFVPTDFRDTRRYSQAAFKLILSIYDISMRDPVILNLYDSLGH